MNAVVFASDLFLLSARLCGFFLVTLFILRHWLSGFVSVSVLIGFIVMVSPLLLAPSFQTGGDTLLALDRAVDGPELLSLASAGQVAVQLCVGLFVGLSCGVGIWCSQLLVDMMAAGFGLGEARRKSDAPVIPSFEAAVVCLFLASFSPMLFQVFQLLLNSLSEIPLRSAAGAAQGINAQQAIKLLSSLVSLSFMTALLAFLPVFGALLTNILAWIVFNKICPFLPSARLARGAMIPLLTLAFALGAYRVSRITLDSAESSLRNAPSIERR